MKLLSAFKSFLGTAKVDEQIQIKVAQQVIGKLDKGQLPSPPGALLLEAFRAHCMSLGKSAPVPHEEITIAYEEIKVTYRRLDPAKGRGSSKGWNIEQGSAWQVEEGEAVVMTTQYMSAVQGGGSDFALRKRPGRAKFELGPNGYTEVEWTYLKNNVLGFTPETVRGVANGMA